MQKPHLVPENGSQPFMQEIRLCYFETQPLFCQSLGKIRYTSSKPSSLKHLFQSRQSSALSLLPLEVATSALLSRCGTYRYLGLPCGLQPGESSRSLLRLSFFTHYESRLLCIIHCSFELVKSAITRLVGLLNAFYGD